MDSGTLLGREVSRATSISVSNTLLSSGFSSPLHLLCLFAFILMRILAVVVWIESPRRGLVSF